VLEQADQRHSRNKAQGGNCRPNKKSGH
jgi:hypothetical protein